MPERFFANAALLAGSLPAVRGLRAALRDPAAAQRRVLARLMSGNAGTVYGRACGAHRVRTLSDFQDAVPEASYEDLEPYISRAMDGEPGVLTAEPVRLFEVTSGSTGAAKLIPYTASLQAEFRRAVGAWLGELALERPAILLGPSYWTVTPLVRAPAKTKGGVPVGFASDAEVLGGWVGRLLEKRLAVPSSVAQAKDLDAALDLTARHLLRARNLAFVSVWNPSFFTLLLERIHADRQRLTRAAGLPFLAGPVEDRDWAAVWPKLGVLSCWADAAAKDGVPALRRAFPRAFIQPKGLLSTEGVVTVPLSRVGGCVPALQSHLLEFRPFDGSRSASGRPRFAHQLEAGAEYEVLLTTGGGLWRYGTGDIVRVSALRGAVPVLEFIGRGAGASDLRGEKLCAAFVGPLLSRLRGAGHWDGPFAMLAPGDTRPPAYRLFVEGRVGPGLAAALEQGLEANPHYAYCRRLGQLGPASVVEVRGAQAAYLARCTAAGTRAGAVKPTALDARSGWEEHFLGAKVPAC